MQIDVLKVYETEPINKIIREIPFKKNQLNLIVDITRDTPQDSGNSVGKTTTVKIIDLCLGARSVNILFKDNDTKSENLEIKEYLQNSKVRADLTLINCKGNRIVVSRDLFYRGKRYINGEPLSRDDFEPELKKVLFNSNTPKPTLRQLMNRFVRLDNKQLENVIDYLDGRNSRELYESIHLSLLNAVNQSDLSDRMDLDKILKEYIRDLNRFKTNNSITSLSALSQKQEIIDNEIKEKSDQRNKIDYIENYKEEINKRSSVLTQLDDLSIDLENIKFDISMMEKSLKSIQSDKVNIDLKDIKSIYDEVLSKVKVIDKQFEELVIFHNKMLDNRASFIYKQLEKRRLDLIELKSMQNSLLEEKQRLSISLVDSELISDLASLNSEIDELNIKKGEVKKLIDIYEDYNDNINKYKESLDSLENQDSDTIEKKISKFNEFFCYYSDILYGEKYYLSYNENWKEALKGSIGSHPFGIENIAGELGTGKKRGLIIAFDLAYLDYIVEENIIAPQFIIHDKLENTHINQLDTIFNLCTNIQGQYIVPILKERINKIDEKIIEQATILELSQDNKFFRI